PNQNLLLIKHLEHFLHFEKPLLVGASRKSVIDFYSPSSVENRLAGSLFLHLKAFENGASIIRTHDVKEHKQLFALNHAMQNISVW
ncbi:MAG: dihydropteroate synthase, partial [Campylobacter sp.]|nr:dihydropteroate synthase [Campylobacter sp.]